MSASHVADESGDCLIFRQLKGRAQLQEDLAVLNEEAFNTMIKPTGLVDLSQAEVVPRDTGFKNINYHVSKAIEKHMQFVKDRPRSKLNLPVIGFADEPPFGEGEAWAK